MQEGLWQHFTQPLATWFCFIFFFFCWQALKGVLIRGLLILLRRSIHPAARRKGCQHCSCLWQLWPKSSKCWAVVAHSQCSKAFSPAPPLLAHCIFGEQQCAFLSSGGTVCSLCHPSGFLGCQAMWSGDFKVVVLLCAFQSYVVRPSYFKDCFLELQPEECLPSDVTPLIFPPQYWLWAEVVRCLPPGPCPRPPVVSLVHLQSFAQSGIVPEGPQQLELPLSLQFLPSPLLWSWLTADPVQATIQTPTCRLNHRKSRSFLQSLQTGFSQHWTSSATSSKDVVVGAESLDKGEW